AFATFSLLSLSPKYPLPFSGLIVGIASVIAAVAASYFSFPLNLRRSAIVRTRLFWFIGVVVGIVVFILGYFFIVLLFNVLNNNGAEENHWLWTGLPLLITYPEIFEFALKRAVVYCFKADDHIMLSLNALVVICVVVSHASFMSLITTLLPFHLCLLLVSMESAKNFRNGFRAISLHKNEDQLKRDEFAQVIQAGIMVDMIEITVPFWYLCLFLVTLYSPNSQMIGNVKFGGWHFSTVSDVPLAVVNLLITVFIDTAVFMVFGVVLWVKCGINVLRVIAFLMKSYGLLILVWHTFLLELIICINDIGCGIDLTLQFKWLTGNEWTPDN
ncbi:hypothetical protein CYMTET_48730, partial [Cymbomonas tetramitiformis]